MRSVGPRRLARVESRRRIASAKPPITAAPLACCTVNMPGGFFRYAPHRTRNFRALSLPWSAMTAQGEYVPHEWREVPGCEGYHVADDGRIAGELVSPERDEQGRHVAILGRTEDKSGRRWLVHHLVWVAFHGSIPPGQLVRFKNGDVSDPRLVNLELVEQVQKNPALSRSRQGERNHRACVSEQMVRDMRADHRDGRSYNYLSKWYGVSKSCARKIVTYQTWRHIE